VERASIDEVYCDVTEAALRRLKSDMPPSPEQTETQVVGGCPLDPTDTHGDALLLMGATFADELRRKIREETTFTVSAGIAHGKMFAKIASAKHKPNKQTIVPFASTEELMRTIELSDIRGLGGKLGEEVSTFLRSQDTPKTDGTFRAIALQAVPERLLIRQFGEKTGRWLHRICRGLDTDPVSPNLRPKSINCFKSFSTITAMAPLLRWLDVLCGELTDRIAADHALFKRRPRVLTLQHRSTLRPDHLKNWKAGVTSELTGMRSRSAALPPSLVSLILACYSSKQSKKRKRQSVDGAATPLVDSIQVHSGDAEPLGSEGETTPLTSSPAFPAELQSLARLVMSKLENDSGVPTLPCSRIALGVSDFCSESKASRVLSDFLKAQPCRKTSAESSAESSDGHTGPRPGHDAVGDSGSPAQAAAGDGNLVRTTCERCGASIALDAIQEHMDFHFAADVQQQWRSQEAKQSSDKQQRKPGPVRKKATTKTKTGAASSGLASHGPFSRIDSFFQRKK